MIMMGEKAATRPAAVGAQDLRRNLRDRKANLAFSEDEEEEKTI